MICMRIISAQITGRRFWLRTHKIRLCPDLGQEAWPIWMDCIFLEATRGKKVLILTICSTLILIKESGFQFTKVMAINMTNLQTIRYHRHAQTTRRCCTRAAYTSLVAMMANLATTTCTSSNCETKSMYGQGWRRKARSL